MGNWISNIVLAKLLLKKVRKAFWKKHGQRKECMLEPGEGSPGRNQVNY